MINKPVSKLGENDLIQLIDKKIGESIKLEYKEKLDLKDASYKKKLCKEVSALANAFGGKIIFGLKESEKKDAGSIPTNLKPIIDSSLKEIMQQVLVDGIIPRVDFQIYSFKSSEKNGEYVVIDIPQSIRGPHFTCINKENRFYIRRDYEARPMTQREIENAYRNFLFQEQKYKDIYSRIKQKDPNSKLERSDPPYCFIYFIPQYPIEDLFYREYTHTTLTEKVGKVHGKGNYLKGYTNGFINSYEGFTNIVSDKIDPGNVYPDETIVERKDIYFRNSCVLYSFSMIDEGGQNYLYLFSFARSILKIINIIPEIYQNCGYTGNLNIIIEIKNIKKYKLSLDNTVTSPFAYKKDCFHKDIKTSIDKLKLKPKKEILPLIKHFMQSFGLYDAAINDFLKNDYNSMQR